MVAAVHVATLCVALSGASACGNGGLDSDSDIGSLEAALVKYGSIEEGTEPPPRLQGGAGVDSFGQASWSLPLVVPPGRQGMAPALTLAYSSGRGSGVFGVGFALSSGESVISRCGQTVDFDGKAMAVQFNEEDRLCLDGSRLVLTDDSANYWSLDAEYRVADGSYLSVRRLSDGMHDYEVRMRDGTRMLYGNENSSTVYANHSDRDENGDYVSTSKSDLEWHVARVVDASGNYMQYIYDANEYPNGAFEHLLYEIHYTGASDLSPNRVVHFDYATRAQQELQFFAGTERRLGHRVFRITMTAQDSLVREYRFTYDGVVGGDQLASVTECDRFDVCREPTTFEWGESLVFSSLQQRTSVPVGWSRFSDLSNILGDGPPWTLYPTYNFEQSLGVADLDGDGFDDLLYSGYTGNGMSLEVRFSEAGEPPLDAGSGVGGTTGGPLTDGAPPMSRHYEIDATDTGIRLDFTNVESIAFATGALPAPTWFTAVDIDQDGRDELLVRQNVLGPELRDHWELWGYRDGVFDVIDSDFLGCENGAYRPMVPLVADFTGDGAVDVLGSCANGPFASIVRERRLVSYDWDVALADPLDRNPSATTTVGDAALPVGRLLVDVDGDGQTEVIGLPQDVSVLPEYPEDSPPAGPLVAVLAVGTEAALLPDVFLPTEDAEGNLLTYVFVDINGDGLKDAFCSDQLGGPTMRLNTGRGFGPEYSALATLPYYVDLYATHTSGAAIHIADFDHDGREDLLVLIAGQGPPLVEPSDGLLWAYTMPRVLLLRSTGSTFEVTELEEPGISRITPGGLPGYQLSHFKVLDMNGDGRIEYTVPFGENEEPYAEHEGLTIRTVDIERGDLLVAVHDGARAPQFGYNLASNPGCGAVYPRVCSQPSWMADAIDENMADSGIHTTHYEVAGGLFDVRRRHSLGLASRRIQDGLTPDVFIEYDQRMVSLGTTGSGLRQALTPFAGMAFRTTQSANGREVISTTLFELQADQHAAAAYRVLNERQIDAVTESGTTLHHVTTYNYFDDWGTVKDVFFMDDLNPLEYSNRHFGLENRASNYLIGLVTRDSMSHYVSGVWETQTTEFAFDDKGRLDKITTEPYGTASEYLEVNRTFDDYGNIIHIAAQDLTGETREQSFSFDSDQVFVDRTENALGHVVYLSTEPGLGVPLTSVQVSADFADAVYTASVYDGFGRALRTHHHGELTDTLSYELADVDGGEGQEMTVTSRAASGQKTQQIYDRAGRVRATRRFYGWSAAHFNQQESSYDVLGRVLTTSNWHANAAPSASVEEFTYDRWSRPTSHKNLDGGETTWVYDGLRTTVNDPRGGETLIVRNTLGRVESREEPDVSPDGPPERSHIGYEYGAFGRLNVTRASGSNTTLTHDILGRVTERNDPDSGTDTMTYNAFGEVLTTTNGAGEHREFTYDGLGRVVQVDDDTVGKSTFEYDNAPGFGVGRIAQASNDGAVTLFEYDDVGRPVRVEQDTGANTLYAETSYDLLTGRRSQMRVPRLDGGELTYAYDYSTYGELTNVSFDGDLVWKAYERDDAMRRVTAELRGPMYVEHEFDPDTHHLTRYSAEAYPETIVERESYSYAPDGRLEGFVDLGGYAQGFSYDLRGRLTGWQRGPTSTTYAYDALGNQIEGASGARTFAENAGPHAVTRDGTGEKFEYDGAGRRLAGSFGWYAKYTSFGLPTLIGDPAGGTRAYAYDALNQRVTEYGPGGVRVDTFGELLQLTTPPSGKGSMTYAVYVEGERVAEVTQDYEGTWTRRYLNSDQVGSSLAWTDDSGVRHEAAVTEPFGAVMSGSASEQRFGSHAFDTSMGLVNARGRIYDPTTAAFLTTDPVRIPTATHMNLYGYAAQDPVNLYDPFGLQPAEGQNSRTNGIEGAEGLTPPPGPPEEHIPYELSDWDGRGRNRAPTFATGGIVIPANVVTSWRLDGVNLPARIRSQNWLLLGVDIRIIRNPNGSVTLRARQTLGRPFGSSGVVSGAIRVAQDRVLRYFGGDGVTRTLAMGNPATDGRGVLESGGFGVGYDPGIGAHNSLQTITVNPTPVDFRFEPVDGLGPTSAADTRLLDLSFGYALRLYHEFVHFDTGYTADEEELVVERVNRVRGALGLPTRYQYSPLRFRHGQRWWTGRAR